MSPKEKAQALYNEIWKVFPAESSIHFELKPFIKDCVLVLCNEIISENIDNNVQNEIAYTIAIQLTNQQYWDAVKKELLFL